MQQPLVSVIVPVLDVAGLLPRCLDSLLAQTYRPLEIIVVNDGSSDDSGAVLDGYAARHPEIRAVHQEHRGLGPARNAALLLATGEYVAMIDADDWVEPDFITDTVRIAGETGADAVATRFWFVTKGINLRFPFRSPDRVMTGLQAAELSMHMLTFPAFAWNKLYRRDLFHPGEEPFPNIYYEDLATTPRVLARARTVAQSSRAYYRYCLRKDSITGDFGIRNVFGFAAALRILRVELHRRGLWEAWYPTYKKLLRDSRMMMSIQVLLQRNGIPLRSRLPLLARFARRLDALAEPGPMTKLSAESRTANPSPVVSGQP